MLGESENMYM
jgi:hypothetical protein